MLAAAEEMQEQAEEALHRFVGSAMVFVIEGPPDERKLERANGSGTLLRTPAGRVILLTAAHVLQDESGKTCADIFSLGGIALPNGAVADSLTQRWVHSSADVAVARVSAAEAFGSAPVPTSLVATPSESGIEGKFGFRLGGFPAGYRRESIAGSYLLHGMMPLTYATTLDGLDERGRFKVRWEDSIVVGNEDSRHLGLVAGKEIELVHPRGISGGPLWRFAPGAKGELWAPGKIAKLIGVACSYLEPISFVESTTAWGEWFTDVVAQVDAAPAEAEPAASPVDGRTDSRPD